MAGRSQCQKLMHVVVVVVGVVEVEEEAIEVVVETMQVRVDNIEVKCKKSVKIYLLYKIYMKGNVGGYPYRGHSLHKGGGTVMIHTVLLLL